MDLIKKFIFYWRRQPVIVIDDLQTTELTNKLLGKYFKIGGFYEGRVSFVDMLKKEILIFRLGGNALNFLFRNSKKPVLALVLAGENKEAAILNEFLSMNGCIILNFDNEKTLISQKEIKELPINKRKRLLTFGFQEGADLRATDIIPQEDGQLSFKLNCKGSFVPIWIKSTGAEKEMIYPALASASIGIALGLNLVEISQGLQSD